MCFIAFRRLLGVGVDRLQKMIGGQVDMRRTGPGPTVAKRDAYMLL